MTDEAPNHLPFRVVVNSGPEKSTPEAVSSEKTTDGDAWSLDDLEAAYQQALESLDNLDEVVAEAVGTDETPTAESLDELPLTQAAPVAADGPLPFFSSQPAVSTAPTVNQRQVIEALLFVGGATLSTRKLADLLGGSATPEDVLVLIDELNARYTSEGRPYRVQLGEGGCRMQLLNEFEKVRHRVYGVGPREVRLSQDVLEVLAFIAYSQPTTDERLAGLKRESAASSVRQLLRRDLVQIRRNSEGVIQYETTARFLELFGLGDIQDLPLPSDIAFK